MIASNVNSNTYKVALNATDYCDSELASLSNALTVVDNGEMKKLSSYPPPNAGPPGTTIYALMNQREWGLRELAHHTDLSIGHLSKVQSGKAGYSRDCLQRIAKAFNVEVHELYLPPEFILFKRLPPDIQDRVTAYIAFEYQQQQNKKS
jgi:transcriptional regulator with XRE-family HTH domain